MDHVTNLRVLRPSRKKPLSGDVFAMQLPDGQYLFGRLIGAGLPPERSPAMNSNLIYIYSKRSSVKEARVESLTPECLLVPPMFTNRLAWSKGYFETLFNVAISEVDLLKPHCFRTWTGVYVDEYQQQLPAPIEPCGDWALKSYRAIDDTISDALRIPRPSDDA